MKQALMLSVTVAAMICAASAAEAQNVPTLKGTYGDTFSQTCLTSDPNGFNSSFQANPGDTNTLTSGHWKGTWTFNGDGNGTGEFTNLFVGAPIPPSPTTLPPPDAESRLSHPLIS